jgi:hypothetical protein
MGYNHTSTTQTQPWAADWRARAIAIYQAMLDRLQARAPVALQRDISMYPRLSLITHTSRAAERPVASVPNLMAGDWKARSVAAYRQAQSQEIATLPAELASQVLCLTGRTIALESILVDLEAQTATASVEGAVFRLRHGQLVLVRPNVECGNQHFESPPLATQADLGYALSVWQPQCPDAQPDDPANWLDYQSL